jgi:hypothetical protein
MGQLSGGWSDHNQITKSFWVTEGGGNTAKQHFYH